MKLVGKRNSKKDNNNDETNPAALELDSSEDIQVQSHVQITVPPAEELRLDTPQNKPPKRIEPQVDEQELLVPNADLDDTSDVALKEALNELLGGTAGNAPGAAKKEKPSKKTFNAPDTPAKKPVKAQKKTAPSAPKEVQPQVPPPSHDEEHAAAPPVPELHAYPDVKMSDKQLEALKSVLGPPADQAAGKKQSTRKASRGASKKKTSQVSVDELINKEDRKSVAKTATLIVILVIILVAAALGGLYYWWTEHATFEYVLQPVVMLEGQHVAPDEFIEPVEEMAGVSAAFEDPGFEPIVGLQFVPLTLKKGLRTVESAAALYVLSPVEYIEHELAEEGTIRPIETLQSPEVASRVSFDVRFTENPGPLESYPVGDFPLFLALNDVSYEIILRIVDTTPPTATSVDQTIMVGEDVLPESFITDVFDESPPVTITFVEYPNVFAREVQTVQIAVADDFGNTAHFSAELTVTFNQEPPIIDGAPHIIEFEIDNPIDYLEGVTAFDDFGRELEVQIDLHGVNEDTEGTYTAVYYAEDLSGHRSEIEVVVHVISVSPDYVNERVDEILARILRDGMSQERKITEIHNWVRWTLSPADVESDTESITAAAYKAIRDRRGDSHVYAAISELLLTRAGIENMRIERTPEAEKKHFWMIVNPDDKGWHHFDAFPTGVSALNTRTNMFTDTQAKDFAERIEKANGPKDYYTYVRDLYPEIVGGGSSDDDD